MDAVEEVDREHLDAGKPAVMPYGTGLTIIAVCLAVVFATFLYLVVNGRTIARLFRKDDNEIVVGDGRGRASKGAVTAALVLHFGAWIVAGLVFINLVAENRATAPDVTPLEDAGVVDANGSSPR